jgi:hypothetical protein
VNYPEALGDYLEHLWEEGVAKKLPDSDIQAALDQLGKWVSTCERASPGGFFGGFK